jgi:hypothetical protein
MLKSQFLDCITNFSIRYRNSIYGGVLIFMDLGIWDFGLL